jgi:UDP-3-O-[3-hydroxymyristoyl] glucosamine N-acyltransferase
MKNKVRKTLQELADLVGAKLQGDPSCLISGIASLESARKGELSFLSNRQYRKYLQTTAASAVIISPEDAALCPINALISDNPRLSLVKVAKLFEKNTECLPGIHPSCVIGEGCSIPSSVSMAANCVIGNQVVLGEGVILGPGCVIGNDCQIGSHTTLKPRVTLYDNVRVGEQCLIHSGVVIGSDGFGFAHHAGAWIKMPHLGGVMIGDQVEIGANTTIDRGFLEDTTLGNGVIIDNLVQIGHNVIIGARTAIAGCVGIAGSTSIGESCLIGGGSSIAGHIQIGDRVHITGTSAVNHSLTTPGVYSSGFPAKPNHQWRRNVARFSFIDDMAKRLRALENKVQANVRLMEAEDE